MDLETVIAKAPPVTLEEMLDAREQRAARQRKMLETKPGCLVSFSLNIPGCHKAHSLAAEAFREGMDLLTARLGRAGLAPVAIEEIAAKTGFESCIAVDGDALETKKIAVAIEDHHPVGRLFDMDVLNGEGTILRGGEAGRKERSCLICGSPVWACARSRTHSAEELALAAGHLLKDFFDTLYADRIAALATRALLHEVAATPKPGLVDRTNNGSHRDMTMGTFIDSSVALTPYFRDITRQGMDFAGRPGEMLSSLRPPGQLAEDRMFAATGGVNTHKGLVFSFGILCAALGLMRSRDMAATVDRLLELCGEITAEIPGELERSVVAPAPTHGERVYRKFGLTGVRGEAARGYPHVREHGYPALCEALRRGASLNDAGVAALLHLLAHVQDTNIVSRSDLQTLDDIQQEVRAFLWEDWTINECFDFAAGLDERFITRNLSPGGCADLLAVSYFLHFVDELWRSRPDWRIIPETR